MLNPVLDRHVAQEALGDPPVGEAAPHGGGRRAAPRGRDLPTMTTGVVLCCLAAAAAATLAASAAGGSATIVWLVLPAVVLFVGSHPQLAGSVASLHDGIRALRERRATARHQRTRQRLCSLLGSIGAPPPTGDVDGSGSRQVPGSPAPPALLEATVRAQCRLIRRVDAALEVLQTATSLHYRLGAACPSVALVEQAAVGRRGPDAPAGAAAPGQAAHVSLPALRRILRDILRDQRGALLSVLAEEGLEDAAMDLRRESEVSLPSSVVTLSWIRSARNELAASLSECVAQSFAPPPPPPPPATPQAPYRRCRKPRLAFLLDMTLDHLAHLGGVLSCHPPYGGNGIHGGAAARALPSLTSKCRALQAMLSQLGAGEFDANSMAEREHWKLVVDLVEDMAAFARATVATLNVGPRLDTSVDEPAAGKAANPVGAVAVTAEPEEYVVGNMRMRQTGLQSFATPEAVGTVVYVGEGAVKPKRYIAPHSPMSNERSPLRLNPVVVSSLVSELSQHLKSLPKAKEVEVAEEEPYAVDVSGCVTAETDLEDESEVSAVSTSLMNGKAGLFIGDLSQTLSQLGVSDEHYDSRQYTIST